jgi:hypothetical protein
MIVVHVLAQPVGLIQRCARCGEILIDYRKKFGMNGADAFWRPGYVAVSDGLPKRFLIQTLDAIAPEQVPCDGTVGIHS